MKYHYCKIKSCDIDYVYKKAEFLESIGYQIVGNGVFSDDGLFYEISMRKVASVDLNDEAKELNKLYKRHLIMMNLVSFISGAIFVYLVF